MLNGIHKILRKHNLEQACPTKEFQTQKVRRWLAEMELPALDRLEMNLLLPQWELLDEQLEAVEAKIAERAAADEQAKLLESVPGMGHYSAVAIASRIGNIERFKRPDSLANYFGLTPGCRNSGEATQRLGSITKQGQQDGALPARTRRWSKSCDSTARCGRGSSGSRSVAGRRSPGWR